MCASGIVPWLPFSHLLDITLHSIGKEEAIFRNYLCDQRGLHAFSWLLYDRAASAHAWSVHK
jgi:hypothetical protein